MFPAKQGLGPKVLYTSFENFSAAFTGHGSVKLCSYVRQASGVDQKIISLLDSKVRAQKWHYDQGNSLIAKTFVQAVFETLITSSLIDQLLAATTSDQMYALLKEFQGSDYQFLSARQRLHILSLLVTKPMYDHWAGMGSNGEGIALAVLKASLPAQGDSILGGLEKASTLDLQKYPDGTADHDKALVSRLFSRIDDAFIFGNDNLMGFMQALKVIVGHSPSLKGRVQELKDGGQKGLITWETGSTHQPGDLSVGGADLLDNGQVKVKMRVFAMGKGIASTDMPYHLPGSEKEFKPFQLVRLISQPDLSLVSQAVGPATDDIVEVPAVFIAFIAQKQTIDNITTTGMIALDVVSLATGAGELSLAIEGASYAVKLRRVWQVYQLANAGANLAVHIMGDQVPPSVKIAVDIWNVTVIGIHVGNLSVQGFKSASEFLDAAMSGNASEKVNNADAATRASLIDAFRKYHRAFKDMVKNGDFKKLSTQNESAANDLANNEKIIVEQAQKSGFSLDEGEVTDSENISSASSAAPSGALAADGTFVNKSVESDFQDYIARKTRKGLIAKVREDWKAAVDNFKYDSPIARGNRFNEFAVKKQWYDYNEIVLENGKRLDAYVPPKDGLPGEIISRKATSLEDIKLSTFEAYLKEMKVKYAPGTTIRSLKYKEDLFGTVLEGNLFLEIPEVNQTFEEIGSYTKLAQEKYNIILRFKPEP